MDKKLEVDQEDLIRIWKLLENLRVSLHRIGSANSQGREKMRMALEEYFTSREKFSEGIYGEIAKDSEVLTRLLIKELGEETVDKLSREIAHLKFGLNKPNKP